MFSLRRSLSLSTNVQKQILSSRRSMVTSSQEVLNQLHKSVVSGHANPIFGTGPPLAGPNGYASSADNPFVGASSDSILRSAYRFDCHSTRNNTITTLSSLTYTNDHFKPPHSQVIAWFSGGSLKFKKSQRASYEAGYQCAIHVFQVLEKLKKEHGTKVTVDLYFNGFGQGREALKTALMATEGAPIRDTIRNVTDCTAIKIGGTRARKARRL